MQTRLPSHDEAVAIALSGGGSRAVAFHLGCFRALHHVCLLDSVATISSVSGGSVLAALYCSHGGDFDSFERKVRSVLARGLVRPSLRIALTTFEGPKAGANALVLVLDRICAWLVRLFLRLSGLSKRVQFRWLDDPAVQRRASRTTILRRALGEIFGGGKLPSLRKDRPKLIILACELQDKSAFYFSAEGVGSWRRGTSDPSNIEIAQAVTASAAYPALLPALDELMAFAKDGKTSVSRTILTDGGVYDNLGLSPFWPDRDPNVSLHVEKYDRIIACRAGYGLKRASPSLFWPSRMISVLLTALTRTENISINRLYDMVKTTKTKAITPYLGQNDARLRSPPPNLVRASEVAGYPTDFSAMPMDWIDKLSLRGEQLTLALMREHWPEIIGQ